MTLTQHVAKSMIIKTWSNMVIDNSSQRILGRALDSQSILINFSALARFPYPVPVARTSAQAKLHQTDGIFPEQPQAKLLKIRTCCPGSLFRVGMDVPWSIFIKCEILGTLRTCGPKI